MKCPVCDSQKVILWSIRRWQMPGNQREYKYLKCLECFTIFCDPRPTRQELSVFYENHFNYHWYNNHLALKKIQAAHRWHRMANVFDKYQIHRGELLDIGCGHGLFLSAARRANWRTIGIDFPSLATQYAKNKLGFNTVENSLHSAIADSKIPLGRFNLITAWHYLEHDEEPVETMKAISKLLAPNGKVLIAMPNAESLGMKNRKEEWVWCQPPYVHIFHFSHTSLSLLALRAGLNVLAVWTRDTWDAHPAYDISLAPRLLKFNALARRINRRAAFWLEEGSRLACYFTSCYKHWLFGRERTDFLGSELLLLAEKNQCDQKGNFPNAPI